MIVLEKPFCLTPTARGVSGNTCPSPNQWKDWRGQVFAFDHYFMRLWALQNLEDLVRVRRVKPPASPTVVFLRRLRGLKSDHADAGEQGFGRVIRLIFRLREPVDDFKDWPTARSAWRAGPVQDLAAHAVPLFLLFGVPPIPGSFLPNLKIQTRAQHPLGTYFAFRQDGWQNLTDMPRGEIEVDVAVGWYPEGRSPEPDIHDRFLCVEYERGRIWGDLGEPFLILIEKYSEAVNERWAYGYPQGPNVRRVDQFATTDPVHLMISSVLASKFIGSAPPIGLLPISSDEPEDITAQRIVAVLDDWDEQFRTPPANASWL